MKRVVGRWTRIRALATALATAFCVLVTPMAAVPAHAASSGGEFHVFGASPSGNLFQNWFGSSWSGYATMGAGNGGEALEASPAVAYDPDNGTYHVFAVGRTSGNVYQVTFAPGVGWTDWQNLGGSLQGGLSAVYENGTFEVFGTSPGGNLFEDWYGSSGWSGWSEITGGNDGEALAGGPAVAYDPDNGTFHVFSVGKTTGNTYQVTFVPGAGWKDWQNLGGGLQAGLSAVYENGTFEVFGTSPGGNLFEDWYGSSGWSGWGEITGGNDGEALGGGPAVAYDSDNGTFHVFAVGKTSGNTYQVTYVPGAGWKDWQNLGGTLQNGGLAAAYVAPPDLGKNIANIAEGQIGYTEPGNFCNKYSTYWGQGCEEWCADFAAWVWQQAGVSFTYAWTTGDLNGGAVSFYQWASAKGTWHPAGSGYTPRPGDAVVYGVNSSGTWAAHVAVVTSYTPGDAGPNVVNGDFSHAVQAGTDQTTNGGGYGISGYASPA